MREYRWEKADLLHRAELACEKGELDEALAADLNKAWPPSSPDHSELDQTLENRFRAALAGKKPEMKPGPGLPGSAEAARKVCINLEFLAGLPGPEKEKDLRMQYQVERLSASMSGERERVSAVDEARQLEQEWLSLGLLSERDYQALRKRVTAALSAIFEE
jgi:hypothetical protein